MTFLNRRIANKEVLQFPIELLSEFQVNQRIKEQSDLINASVTILTSAKMTEGTEFRVFR